MEMINTAAYQELSEADMPATPQDMAGLRQQMAQMCTEMRKHRSELIYWVLGSYFGTMLLAGALLSLLLTGMYHLYGLLT